MLAPEQALELLRRRFAERYPDWARGLGSWPLRVPLGPPTTAQRAESPIVCHEWAHAWAAYPGPGEIEHANLRFPTAVHRMPRTLVLHRAADVAAAHAEDRQVWNRCGQRLVQLQETFPDARFTGLVRRITELPDLDYERLVRAVTWLRANPASGLFLRQLPIEGIDTKWLGAHATLVLAMLGDDPEHAAAGEPLSGKRALHRRLGLLVVPELVQVNVCDAGLRVQFAGMRHFAATVADLNWWPRPPSAVVILENKETGFAVTDDHPGLVVLHGHGFHVEQYARISWVRSARQVLYWGDLDVPGLQFVSDLRGHGVPARTILTDTGTLDRYRHLAVVGALPQRTTAPPGLSPPEQELYARLTAYAAEHGTGLLLEQERVPWPVAYAALKDALDKA
ncbi:DUF3322 domain-containing protein [Crossiella sp. CA-258035]|uniref:DUF3322 domain-containing protein n=1 Tax=Crossiella sp. CA-258035 TaxID=2981138 RepID=UPI0024BC8CB0|nr:DUF3322 domain-containing protein [Crossiella sp. CA-258035]WHT22655.1 DUF3322 domain-containing protein [Crossiella sp. CA-258035]